MDLRGFRLLEGIPRTALIIGIPVIAFVVTMGLTLAQGGDDAGQDAPPTLQVGIQKSVTTPTTAPVPSATAVPNRPCAEIRGTAYRSDAERDYFLKSCSGADTASTTGSTGSTGGATTSTQAAAAPRKAVETSSGDRMIINRIGVDASITRTAVGGDGVMPDPVGYDNAVLYDFSSIPGLGGSPTGRRQRRLRRSCRLWPLPRGPPGAAVFYYMRNLGARRHHRVLHAGRAIHPIRRYYVGDYPPNADWGGVVASAGRI